MPLIVSSPSEHIAELRINRPVSKGALNKELVEKIIEAFDHFLEVTPPRAIILSSEGSVFCAGADLKERKNMSMPEIRAWLKLLHKMMDKIESFPIPVIASIQGPALGGGMELSLACDFRIITANTFFQLPEVTLGIIPAAGGTFRATQFFGKALALELILANKKIDATMALQQNFCMEVCESENELKEKTLKFAKHIANLPPLAVRAAKSAIHGSLYQEKKERSKFEMDCYEPCLKSEDRLEALHAFLEKRAPKFKGY